MTPAATVRLPRRPRLVEIIRHLTVATLLAVRAHSRNAAIPVRDDPLAAAQGGLLRLALKGGDA